MKTLASVDGVNAVINKIEELLITSDVISNKSPKEKSLQPLK